MAFYLSFIWLFAWSIRFPLNCVFHWDGIFIFSSFHLISVSCPTINKHISGFFRILGSWRSVWGKSSYISFLRIPFFLLYRNFHYLYYVLVLFGDLCFVFCLWFLWFWVRRTWIHFGSIFPWNVIFLSSSYRLISVSLPTIYNHITSIFQVIQEQVKCMKKYLFGKFHSNSPITSFVMSVIFGYYFFDFMYAL